MEISLFTRSIMGIKFVLPEMCSTAALDCDPLSVRYAANAQPDCTARVGVILSPLTKNRLEIIRSIRAGEGSAPLLSRGSNHFALSLLDREDCLEKEAIQAVVLQPPSAVTPLSDRYAANAQPDCTARVGVILNPRTKDRLEKSAAFARVKDRLRCRLAGANHVALSLLNREHCREKGAIEAVVVQPPSAVTRSRIRMLPMLNQTALHAWMSS